MPTRRKRRKVTASVLREEKKLLDVECLKAEAEKRDKTRITFKPEVKMVSIRRV